MSMRWWFASAAVVSVLLVGGCGSVTPAGSGTGGSAGEAGSGGSGSAGTTGGAGRSGTAGTDAGGSGGRGGVDGTAGTSGGAGVTGAGGVAIGGRGGTTGTAGAGATGTGGVAVGGRGGTTGTAGTTGTGGIATGGRGGTTGGGGTGGVATGGRGGSTGAGGTGGGATGGRGGGNAGTGGGVSNCPAGGCPPLMISDLTGIDVSGAPGFDATGFRCKSLTICPNSSSCIYYATDMFGSLQSMEATYTDGAEVQTPAPTKLRLDTGAASQCGNPSVTFTASDTIIIQFDGGKKLTVLLPAFMGTSLTLYIATDGSTYYDAALTQPAHRG